MTLLAANMTGMQTLLAWLTILVCGLLMLVIMLQRGRGGGLAGAFGGGGGSSAFGAKTGDVFTWITVIVATVFLLLTVASNYAFDRSALAVVPASVTSGDDAGAEPISTDAPDSAGTKTITIGPKDLEKALEKAAPPVAAGAAQDQGEAKTEDAAPTPNPIPVPVPAPVEGGPQGEDWNAQPPSTDSPSGDAPDAKPPEPETKPKGEPEDSSGQ